MQFKIFYESIGSAFFLVFDDFKMKLLPLENIV